MHSLFAGKPESNDLGNTISVRRFAIPSMTCINRYKKKIGPIINLHLV